MSEVIYTIEDLKQSPLVQQEHVTLKMYKKKITPAAIIHCHKVALAFIGICHLIVEKTQVDLSEEAERREKQQREEKEKEAIRRGKSKDTVRFGGDRRKM